MCVWGGVGGWGGWGWEEGKKGRELGREEKGAPVKNPLLFISAATGVCKFLIGCAVMSNLFTFIK